MANIFVFIGYSSKVSFVTISSNIEKRTFGNPLIDHHKSNFTHYTQKDGKGKIELNPTVKLGCCMNRFISSGIEFCRDVGFILPCFVNGFIEFSARLRSSSQFDCY